MSSCKNETSQEVKPVETDVALKTEKVINPDANFVKTEFTIDGMTCAIGCAKTIEKNINNMDGVKDAKVDYDRKLAMVEYDKAIVNHETLINTVTKTANTYKVSDVKDVEDFTTSEKHMENCDKACCKDKTEAEKMACTKDCKKACCADKKEEAQ
jgi:Cu+-exporting ATPase